MEPIPFYVRDWGYWTPDQATEKPETVPAILRRRVSSLGREALSVAWGLPEAKNARFILSSRHGEFTRTLSLLEAATNQSELSPADFALSVHNALIGLLSIARSNRKGHTAIAAGQESFCFGLLEAIACLKENPDDPVVLIHFDEPLPGSFAEFTEAGEKPIALALALTAKGEKELITMSFEDSQQKEKFSPSHADDFLNFMINKPGEALSVGTDRQWRWTRHV